MRRIGKPPPEGLDLLGIRARIVRWVRRKYGTSSEDAEDLVDEAFVRMSVRENLDTEIRDHSSYWIAAVKNLARNAYEHEHYVQAYALQAASPTLCEPVRQPDEICELNERFERLIKVLETLEPRTRDIFWLRKWEDAKLEDIAKQFGISVSTVQRELTTALDAIVQDRLGHDE
jgi:RNA polymerase sigma-70 factor (ECF subfamily)